MPFLIETERLRLRPFRSEDAETIYAYRNDPLVYKYQGWSVPYTHEDVANFLEKVSEAVIGTPGEWFQTAIELKSTGQLIGDVAFQPRRHDIRQVMLGYTLAQQYWHQGYAREAVGAIVDFLFTELNIHRIVAECDLENVASIHLLERLGFRREAHHIESYWLGDRWGDEYQYALLEREWKK